MKNGPHKKEIYDRAFRNFEEPAHNSETSHFNIDPLPSTYSNIPSNSNNNNNNIRNSKRPRSNTIKTKNKND